MWLLIANYATLSSLCALVCEKGSEKKHYCFPGMVKLLAFLLNESCWYKAIYIFSHKAEKRYGLPVFHQHSDDFSSAVTRHAALCWTNMNVLLLLYFLDLIFYFYVLTFKCFFMSHYDVLYTVFNAFSCFKWFYNLFKHLVLPCC